jgi:hypothetical protein
MHLSTTRFRWLVLPPHRPWFSPAVARNLQEISIESQDKPKLGFKPAIQSPVKHPAMSEKHVGQLGHAARGHRPTCKPEDIIMMKFLAHLAATLATDSASKGDHMKCWDDYWVSPDPFLYMATVATVLRRFGE